MSKPKPGEGLKCHPMTPEQLARFEAFYASHYRTLFRCIPNWSKYYLSTDDIEDLASEAWARAYRFFATFDNSRGTPEAWMNTLTRRVLMDWGRRNTVRPQEVSLNKPFQEGGTRTFEAVLSETRPLPLPESEPEGAERAFQRAARLVCEVMGPRSAEAVLLYMRGLSHCEIGQKLAVSEQASKSLVARGYATARKSLAKRGVESERQLLSMARGVGQ